MRLVRYAVLAGALLLGLSAPSSAQNRGDARTALVIGNAAYSYSRLNNPVNDARDMSDALRAAGFEVILKTDADQRSMKDAIQTFGSAIQAKGGVGLLFFSGHGVQSRGDNYILPIGPPPGSEDALKVGSVTASEAVDAMAAARNALNIVILDACRDNPFPGSGTRGLSRIDSSSNLFVSYATSPGEVALDGSGRNSPYTKHLKGAIGTSNITLEDTFKRTLKGVYQETSGKQQPWMSSSFFGDFIFRQDGAAPPPAIQPPQQQAGAIGIPPRASPGAALLVPGFGPALAGVYYAEGTNPNGTRYRGMVALTPAGNQYRFTWWIGQQVYTGVGQFAGKMLVVNWGQKNPVIYSFGFGQGDDLDGEWADGTATEKLVLFARAAAGPVTQPDGVYNVEGMNPNGTGYRGSVSIARQGGRYLLDWRVGQTAYRGTGVLDGNVLTVNWGSATPVIYSLAADGSLKGLWSAGRGSETLTPAR